MVCEKQGGQKQVSRQAKACPTCGADVMITGWTETAIRTESFMRFNGRGAVKIASTEMVADKATCMVCGAVLPVKPAELQRVA